MIWFFSITWRLTNTKFKFFIAFARHKTLFLRAMSKSNVIDCIAFHDKELTSMRIYKDFCWLKSFIRLTFFHLLIVFHCLIFTCIISLPKQSLKACFKGYNNLYFFSLFLKSIKHYSSLDEKTSMH